jgi:hypothetical protein
VVVRLFICTLEVIDQVKNCNADLTPNPSPSLGEGSHSKGKIIPSLVVSKAETIAIDAVAPSPYEGEGWGGVCNMHNLESISRR